MSIGIGVFLIMIVFNSLKFIFFLFIGILFFKDWILYFKIVFKVG